MVREPALAFASARAWERWLASHHASSQGVWLKIAKSGTGIATVTKPEALDVALCYGWIDGQGAALDEEHWLQRFTPRKPKSRWSKINRAKAEALIVAGRMRPAGAKEVERAKADGRWDAAYDSPRTAAVPPDLERALAARPGARAFFAELDGANRYAVLYRVEAAKRPETRARRIAELVAMLDARRTIHPVTSRRRSSSPR